jgi:mannose-6-phosphate isomerase-like protein (cupin superfamily)
VPGIVRDSWSLKVRKPVRRVVTTMDRNGRSRVLSDGHAPLMTPAVAQLWVADPAHPGISEEAGARLADRLEPPHGGSVFRLFEVAPISASAHLSPEERRNSVLEYFDRLKARHLLVESPRHPAMHRHETIDYIVVLSGRVTLVLDDAEVDLMPFDCVIQGAANHAWENRATETAFLMSVMVTAGV